MLKHASHMWMCGAMIVAALAIGFATGSPAALLPAVGCVVMMLVMMRMMDGHGRGGNDPRE